MKPAVGQRWYAAAGYEYDVIRQHPDDKRLLIRCDDGYESAWLPYIIAADTYLGPTPSPEAPAVAAPPTVTAGADRSGCKAWCGLRTTDDRVPWAISMGAEKEDSPLKDGSGLRYDQRRDDGFCWSHCTALCRDERRPPIVISAAVSGTRSTSAEAGKPAVRESELTPRGTGGASAAPESRGISVSQSPGDSSASPANVGITWAYIPFETEAAKAMHDYVDRMQTGAFGLLGIPSRKTPPAPRLIACPRCKVASADGKAHNDRCPERFASWTAQVSALLAERANKPRDTFADLATVWDCLPTVRR